MALFIQSTNLSHTQTAPDSLTHQQPNCIFRSSLVWFCKGLWRYSFNKQPSLASALRLLFLQAHRGTTAHFNATGLHSQQNRSDNAFRFKHAAFYMGLKSKVGLLKGLGTLRPIAPRVPNPLNRSCTVIGVARRPLRSSTQNL